VYQRADDMVVGCEGDKRAPAGETIDLPLVGEMAGRPEGGVKELGLAYLLGSAVTASSKGYSNPTL